MEAVTFVLLAYAVLVVVSLVVSGLRHPVKGTGGPDHD